MGKNKRVKQPTHCDDCGTKLEYGECGEGWCPKCQTYVQNIEIGMIGTTRRLTRFDTTRRVNRTRKREIC